MGGDDAKGTKTIILLLIFVCVIVLCVAALLVWMNGGSPGSLFSASAIANALANFKFSQPVAINTGGGSNSTTNPFSFNEYTDFTVGSFANMGPATSGKTLDQCNTLCGSTPNCVGFSNDNGCQLYNNVNILDRQKGSTVYASGDIGAVQYLHIPYQNVTLPMAPQLWSNTGDIGVFVSNCQAHHTTCKGFSVSGSDALMYPSIIALDSTQPGNTYVDPNSPARFIKEGSYSYSDTPDLTWTLDPSYQFTAPPTRDQDWFVPFSGQGTGFDAGLDHLDGPPLGNGQMSNVLTVTGLSQCQNACVSNSWCQSITMIGANQCYQRHDFVPQHFRAYDNATGQACIPTGPPLNCACGTNIGNALSGSVCNDNYSTGRDGTSGTPNTSYVKKQYPLSISCPQACSQDGSCIMVTYDNQGNCNQYNTPPTNKTGSSTVTSVWSFNNFPR
jgi:hypothetical protein